MKYNIIGNAAGYTPVIMDVILDISKDYEIDIFHNLEIEEPILHYKEYNYNLKKLTSKAIENSSLVFGVNGPKAKRLLYENIQAYGLNESTFLNLIHPSSYLSNSTVLSTGIIIEPMVCVSSQTRLDFGLNIKRSVSIGHHCVINKFVEINPGVTICSNVEIGEGAIIGAGSIIKDNVKIGANTIIGMGSVVVKDIPSNVVAYGSPCKVIRDANK